MRIDDYPEQMQLQFLSSSSISEVERNYTSPNEMINNIGKEFSSWVLLHPYLILDIILLLLSLIPNLSCLHLVLKRLLSSSTTKTTRGYLHVSMLTCAITFSVIAMLLHTTTIDAELLPFSKIPTPYIFSNYSFCALILALFLLPAGAMPSNLVFLFVDQVLAVVHPYRTMKRSVRKARSMAVCYIAVSWTLSTISATSLFLLLTLSPQPHNSSTQNRPVCSFHDMMSSVSTVWVGGYLLLHFYLPILSVVVLTAIFHKTVLSKSSTETRPLYITLPPNGRRRCFKRTTTRNLTWTCVLVCMAWLPFAALRTLQIPFIQGSTPWPSKSNNQMFEHLLRASEVLWHMSIMFTPCILVIREHRQRRGGLFSNSSTSYSYSSTFSASYGTVMMSLGRRKMKPWRKHNNYYSCSSVTRSEPMPATHESQQH